MSNWLSRLVQRRAPGRPLEPALRETLAHWRTLPAPDLGRTHAETRYVILNTRASGLDIDRDRLLSIGAIAIDGCRLALNDSYHASLDADPADAMAELLTFTGAGPVVVYNAPFNRTLLERAFEEHLGLTPEWLWLDLYWLLPALFGEHSSEPTKLAKWMHALDIETFQRFHALGDAYVLARLMLALESRALKRGLSSPRSLADLERARRRLDNR